MIGIRDMPAGFNFARQIRTADRLRACLARDETSGLPRIGYLSVADQGELFEVGDGRLSAVVLQVSWIIDALPHPRAVQKTLALVMTEVARLVDKQVRRTDLVGSLNNDSLLILAPALDPVNTQSLADRLRDVLADRELEVGDLRVHLRVRLGISTRWTDSPAGWTTPTLAAEAVRNASGPPPIASVA